MLGVLKMALHLPVQIVMDTIPISGNSHRKDRPVGLRKPPPPPPPLTEAARDSRACATHASVALGAPPDMLLLRDAGAGRMLLLYF